MRRTGKAIALPAIGIVVAATANGVRVSLLLATGVAQPATAPVVSTALVANHWRRRVSVIGVS